MRGELLTQYSAAAPPTYGRVTECVGGDHSEELSLRMAGTWGRCDAQRHMYYICIYHTTIHELPLRL